MAALIAPNMVRYTLSGTFGPTTWANVLDYVLVHNTGIPRPQAIAEHAEVLNDVWEDQLAPLLHVSTVLNRVSWVDLSTADGSTGQIAGTASGNDSTNDPLPANVSILVRKIAPGGGRQARNGRLYQVGFNEESVANVEIAPAAVVDLQEAFQGFLDGTSENSGIDFPNYSANMVVIHQTNQGTPQNPDYVFAGSDFVSSMVVDPIIATQRRRARR